MCLIEPFDTKLKRIWINLFFFRVMWLINHGTEARIEFRQFVNFANMQKLNKYLSTMIAEIGI